MVLFVVNALWLLLMLELTSGNAVHLNVMHTNPLGLTFLFIYGGIFVLQFITLVIHRSSTAIQLLSSVKFPRKQKEATGS